MVDKDGVFKSKDYWLILGLVSLDAKLLEVKCEQDERGQSYLMWLFECTPEVLEVERKYNLNQPIMIDLQKAKSAAEVFKRNLQFHRIR